MTKDQVVDRLRDTLHQMITLKEEQFDMEAFVTDHDSDLCPTVCCIAGWYPVWFPDAGFIWTKGNTFMTLDHKDVTETDFARISEKLSEYHGISQRLIYVLFYGNWSGLFDDLPEGQKATLEFIIKLWTRVIELINNEELSYILTPYNKIKFKAA